MQRVIQFESHRIELAIVYELEHDPNVLEYFDQPCRIPLSYVSSRGRKVRAMHTPDFFVLRTDSAGWEECKSDGDLEKLSEKNPHRYGRACDHGRLPQTAFVDGGTEFKSTYFETLLARYACAKKTRPPAKPRFGSVCERLFGTVNTQFIYNLRGNTQMTRNVRQVTKSVDPRRMATWSLRELNERLDEYLFQVYDRMEHPALGQSPQEAFAMGLAMCGFRPERTIRYDQDFLMCTMPTTTKGTAKISPGRGVKINHVYYWSDTFRDPEFEQRQLAVPYDPFDAGTAYAFCRNQWVECHAEYYTAFRGRSEKEVMLATRELHKQHQQHSQQRFNLNARTLAVFLGSVEGEETLLVQRLRDRETVSMREGSCAPAPACADGADFPTADKDDRLSAADVPPEVISAATLLMNDCVERTVDWKTVTAGFPRHERPWTRSCRSSGEVRRFLVAALRETDCPSIRELSSRLGYKRAESLYPADRELCHQITAKHRRCHRTHWWREPGATRICDEETLRRLLEESLAQETPTSVRRIAASAGYANGGYIHRKFPDLCRGIARRLEEQRASQLEIWRLALETACAGGSFLTLQAISNQLGLPNSSALRSKFPEQCDQLLECRQRHKENATERLRGKLQPILKEEPAPSLSAVCRRLQISHSTLYEHCPELCRAISARHANSQKERTRNRRRALDEEVRRIAGDLRARGQNPTQSRIGSLLSTDSLKEWRALQRSVKRARRFLGLK
jgi:hypothetical protein